MTPYPERTTRHLNHLYGEAQRRHAFRGTTPDDHAAWAAQARPILRDLIGLNQIREQVGDFEPSVTLGSPVVCDGYTRQPGTLQTEPNLDIPFWYVKPDGPGPFPLALFPHGHYVEHGLDYAVGVAASEEMRIKIENDDRDVAIQAVRHGFAGIAPASRGFEPVALPDINNRHGGRSCRSQMIHAVLAGRTATGERVWDLERLIDWAATLPEIDLSNVLMMGNSGGGVVTIFTAACDTRVTTAVASCSYCGFVGVGGVVHHCDCNAVPGILRFGEFWDVAGLIAPRRLQVVHGALDPLFPMDEIDRAVSSARHIFEVADVPDHFNQSVGPANHRFYKDLMWPFVIG